MEDWNVTYMKYSQVESCDYIQTENVIERNAGGDLTLTASLDREEMVWKPKEDYFSSQSNTTQRSALIPMERDKKK